MKVFEEEYNPEAEIKDAILLASRRSTPPLEGKFDVDTVEIGVIGKENPAFRKMSREEVACSWNSSSRDRMIPLDHAGGAPRKPRGAFRDPPGPAQGRAGPQGQPVEIEDVVAALNVFGNSSKRRSRARMKR